MKAILLVATFIFALLRCHAAELKFATLDVQRVLSEYPKAQEATKLIQQKEVSLVKELETLRLEGRRITEEITELRRISLEPVLSMAERENKKQDFEQRLADLRNFEVRYERARTDRTLEFQNYAVRLNKRVMDDVLIATRVVGEKEGFNFVFNASRLHPAAGEVLFTRNVTDVTMPVLANLNVTHPNPQPTAKP